ncbi:MAG: VCBS repeat-containing protein [Pirellulaceae bacterium]|jgi:VCBS repeat-containing protein
MSRFVRQPRQRRHRGFIPALQQLEDRCMLTAQLELVPASGSLSNDGGDAVLEMAPGANVDFSAFSTAAPTVPAVAFQLNFNNSNTDLVLSNWLAASAWLNLDGSTGENILFAGRREFNVLNIGTTPVELGTFNVQVPFTGGDYLLTANGGGSGAFVTALDVGAGSDNVPLITDYGDVILRVPNFAPTVGVESFSTSQNAQLSVGVNDGVLQNDADQNNDALVASVSTDVSFGTLTLQENGAFTYQPDTDFHGTDSFTYSVSDGTVSTTSTVEISVTSTTPWRNPIDPYDVNDDGSENAQDVLVMVNYINSHLDDPVLEPPGAGDGSPPPYLDITGDNRITVRDVLVAVNELNRRIANAQGEQIDISSEAHTAGYDGAILDQQPVLLQPVQPGVTLLEINDDTDRETLTSTDESSDEEVELVIEAIAADVAQIFAS